MPTLPDPLYRESWKDWTPDAIRNTQAIQAANDALRTTGVALGREDKDMVVAVGAITQLAPADIGQILHKVRTFDNFHEGNDPWGEHDFGAVEHGDHKVFFKIDAYDADLAEGSPEPWRPEVTRRVMTVFLAEDY